MCYNVSVLRKYKNILITIFFFTLIFTGALFADKITRPEEARVPTMHTLEDIYNLIHNRTVSTHSLSPSLAPQKSMHSVSEIYIELANLIDANSIAAGTTYLGVTGGDSTPSPLVSPSLSFSPVTPAGTAIGFTLDDIYHLIKDNTRPATTTHSFIPGSTPADSMHSLEDIYTELLSLIDPAKVNQGVTYLDKAGIRPSRDITPPTVTAFSIPTNIYSLTLYPTSFTASDNKAVTGYLITASSTAPRPGDFGWTLNAPISYTFATTGTSTLYAWAKDAAGNVSTSRNMSIVVTKLNWSGDIGVGTWFEGNNYCPVINGAGSRLPTSDELLLSLENQFLHNGSNPGGFESNIEYWSSSNNQGIDGWATTGWFVSGQTNVGNGPKTANAHVRCVR